MKSLASLASLESLASYLMIFIPRQEPFVCENCGKQVEPLEHGSYRNHCPYCLYSKHVDDKGPGDRASDCGGMMKVISVDSDSKKGFSLIHECEICSKRIKNKVAPDDDLQSYFSSQGDSDLFEAQK